MPAGVPDAAADLSAGLLFWCIGWAALGGGGCRRAYLWAAVCDGWYVGDEEAPRGCEFAAADFFGGAAGAAHEYRHLEFS